jgi:hypothetical protein
MLINWFQVNGGFSKVPPLYKICQRLMLRWTETKICQSRVREFGSVVNVVVHLIAWGHWPIMSKWSVVRWVKESGNVANVVTHTRCHLLVTSGWSVVRNWSMSVLYAWKCSHTNIFWKVTCSWSMEMATEKMDIGPPVKQPAEGMKMMISCITLS